MAVILKFKTESMDTQIWCNGVTSGTWRLPSETTGPTPANSLTSMPYSSGSAAFYPVTLTTQWQNAQQEWATSERQGVSLSSIYNKICVEIDGTFPFETLAWIRSDIGILYSGSFIHKAYSNHMLLNSPGIYRNYTSFASGISFPETSLIPVCVRLQAKLIERA
jgi:hypothetical protein